MQLSVREVSKLLNVSEKTIYRLSRMSTSRSTNVHSSVERNIREPGEKVEGLAEVASVVQAPGNRRHVLHRIGDVVRAGLENRAPFVLREIHQAADLRMGMSAARVASGRPSGGDASSRRVFSARST